MFGRGLHHLRYRNPVLRHKPQQRGMVLIEIMKRGIRLLHRFLKNLNDYFVQFILEQVADGVRFRFKILAQKTCVLWYATGLERLRHCSKEIPVGPRGGKPPDSRVKIVVPEMKS